MSDELLYNEFLEFVKSIRWSDPIDKHDYNEIVFLVKLAPGLSLQHYEDLGNIAAEKCAESLQITEDAVFLENIQNYENEPIIRIRIEFEDENDGTPNTFMYPFDIAVFHMMKKMIKSVIGEQFHNIPNQ